MLGRLMAAIVGSGVPPKRNVPQDKFLAMPVIVSPNFFVGGGEQMGVCFSRKFFLCDTHRRLIHAPTRMVQLPATAAIEYVAACCRTRTKTKTKTVRGAYARFPQVQCAYAPSRLSVPSIVAWRTNKQTKKNRQTRPRSSAGSRPPFPKFSGYVEVDAHYIFHPSTIWVRPLFTELGP